MENKGEIIIYKSEDGHNQLDVRLENETIWLSQKLLAQLFGKDSDTIGLHIKNIFKEKELIEKSTTEYFSVVQKEGKRNVNRKVRFYNLDVIISVGYRVNSKRGTQFRIWATQTLKDHLVKGYTINEKRLKEQQEKWKELQQTVEILKTTVGKKELTNKETQGLLEIISQYTRSFVLLNKFDKASLETTPSDKKLTYEIKYREAVAAIEELKKKRHLICLDGNGMKGLKAYYRVSYKLLDVNTCTQRLKNRPRIFYTLLLKIILSRMAINASVPFYLSGFCKQ